MLGLLLQRCNDGIWLLVNTHPYFIQAKFLNHRQFKDMPEALRGCKVAYDGKKLMLFDYFNCERCHRSFINMTDCNCEARDVISALGIYIGIEVNDDGIYFLIKWGHRLLYVTFCPTINLIINNFEPGDFIEFNGVFLDSSKDRDVIRIYKVKF